MTCIAGIVDNKNKCVVIGGDSAGSNGSGISSYKNSKVFRNGDFIFGCTSSFRMIQLLKFSLKVPNIKHIKNTKNDEDPVFRYMRTSFIDEVRKCFKDGGYLQKHEMGDECGGTFLVGYKDRLFRVEDEFHILESISGFDTCGCGEEFARGSLYTSIFYDHNNLSTPAEKVEIALKATEAMSEGVRGPFTILSTCNQIMEEKNKLLQEQFCRLGEMIGDGLHLESNGKWISREYKN